jgi:ubiquinol-cytochrome c reductase iron-sulfur subunit
VITGRLAFLLGALRGVARGAPSPRDEGDTDPRSLEVGSDPRAEVAVAVLLVLGAACAIAFAVLIVVHPQTQIMGGVLAAGLAFVGAALVVASRSVVPREVDVEERHPVPAEEDAALAAQLADVGDGVSRRRLLLGAAGLAGCGLGAAALVPITALGPDLGDAPDRTPWARGKRIVDSEGRAVRADALEVGGFLSAMPEGATLEELGAPIVIVRIVPSEVQLPPERRAWAPRGLLAFSQICTHAGCAITLFRYPVYEPTSKPPALVCPCHYSTFDVRRGAKPVFGPAVRPLAQLPLQIASDGTLVAGGGLSGSVGPSWWGVKQT